MKLVRFSLKKSERWISRCLKQVLHSPYLSAVKEERVWLREWRTRERTTTTTLTIIIIPLTLHIIIRADGFDTSQNQSGWCGYLTSLYRKCNKCLSSLVAAGAQQRYIFYHLHLSSLVSPCRRCKQQLVRRKR